MNWLQVFGLGTVTTSLIGLALWFFKWRLGRLRKKNQSVVLQNDGLRKILKLKSKLDRKKADAKKKMDEELPRDGSTLDPSDPWRELRGRDKER